MRMLRRNWAAGELRVLLLALVIAVGSVTTVGFFADRGRSALDRQANELLGGGLVVISDKPLPAPFEEAARRRGLAIAKTRTFPSMVAASSGVNLAEIKAVTDAFPLRGKLRIVDAAPPVEHEVAGGPKPGTVWIGAPLAVRLGLKLGDTLQVGRAKLAIAAVIMREPDSVLDYFGIAPRVLMHDSDVEATGLVQLGSRIVHRLLVGGDALAVQQYRDEMNSAIGRGQRMEGVRDARSEVRTALERSQRFLGLASLLSVVLASVAVALAARRFSQRQIDAAAMMRCLGATQADLFAIHAWQFAALGAAAFALGLAALSALIVWQAGDVKMGSIAVGGFGAALAVSALAGYGMIRLVSRMRGAASGPWRYGLANLRRRTGASLVQIMALGLGLMAMLMLTLVRTELITKWQQSMPPDMPNRFAINIQSDQLPEVKRYFVQLKLATPDLYPMVRGRLTHIGERSVAAGDFKDERAKRLVEREFNLSWAAANRPDNKIVSGAFWTPDPKEPQFSVEEGVPKTLRIKVGDALAFDVAGSNFGARGTSLRKVDWDSFKPNFFVIANPSLLESYPASWITSFHLPAGRDDVITRIVQRFPNGGVIDLSALIAQFQRITDQVSRAVEFVFLFAIAAGLVVLFAAISSTQDERGFEGAILRTLGADRRQLATLQLAEFLTIGLLAGTIASAGAVGLAMVLAERVLGVPYDFSWGLPLAGIVIGGVGVAIAGLLG